MSIIDVPDLPEYTSTPDGYAGLNKIIEDLYAYQAMLWQAVFQECNVGQILSIKEYERLHHEATEIREGFEEELGNLKS